MRKYYIDNIRTTTVLLVVIYHVIYMFNSVTLDGVIGPITSFHGQDVIQYLLYPWFMVILFILSGMCARYYLNHHTDREFLRSRTRKLLVPSTIGILVFGWIQGYYNMTIAGAFASMPAEMPKPILFLIMILSGTGVLWTIQMMWLYSVILLGLRRIIHRRQKRRIMNDSTATESAGEENHTQCEGDRKPLKQYNILQLLLLAVPFWFCAQFLNTPIVAVDRFGIYGFAFFIGYFLFSREEVTDSCLANAQGLCVLAVILGVLYTYMNWGKNYALVPYNNSPLAMLYAWVACLAVLGGAKRWWNYKVEWMDWLSKKSFGIYVFHYLPLSIAGLYLTQHAQLPGVLVYVICGISSFAGALVMYEIVSRIPVLRWCLLGMRKKRE